MDAVVKAGCNLITVPGQRDAFPVSSVAERKFLKIDCLGVCIWKQGGGNSIVHCSVGLR